MVLALVAPLLPEISSQNTNISYFPGYVQCFAKQTVQGPRYEVNLRVFAIAYHRLKMQLCSWSLMSKKIKTGGFQKCKIQCFAKQTIQGPRYEVNLRVFAIAYHRLKMQLRSWSLLSKKIKTGGFQKCKVHCCNFKDLKVTSLQSLATPGFEPRLSSWVT